MFPGFWPIPGPGRLPLDGDRRDAEFVSVFASVAFFEGQFRAESRFLNPAEKSTCKQDRVKVYGSVFHFRRWGPSKEDLGMFKHIWGVCCTEFACVNG